ncbi:MAG: polysaccharide deacetylase family protein [Flavobacterium sp.]|nr:polysaccharide deacetylase family protein [Flavobacterium sp.]
MIWIKIKYRSFLLLNTLLLKLGFGNRLLKNRYGERILVFHGIDEVGETKYNSRFHSKDFFDQFIQYIAKHYNVISLDDFYNKKFKPNTLNITITFDDGYLNNYKYAVPILEKYGVSATFFITTIWDIVDFLWPDFLDLVSFYTSKNEIIFEKNHYIKNRKNEFVFKGVSLKDRCKKLTFDEIKPLFTIFDEEWKSIQKKPLDDYWQLMNDNQY